MRRRLLIAAAFLVAGMTVNVAVAWVCAHGHRDSVMFDDTHRVGAATGDQSWLTCRPDAWRDAELVSVWRVDEPGRTVMAARAVTRPASFANGRASELEIWTTSYGWPLRSLGLSTWSGDGYYDRTPGIRLARPAQFNHWLPVLPAWSGFAVNTVLYAAALWLPVLGLASSRRVVRRSRGRCTACGYDLRHALHDACPECGS